MAPPCTLRMKTFFHPEQLLHHPRTYFSRGRMREPQEVPERAVQLVQAAQSLGHTLITPPDHGMAPLLAVHDASYLHFLQNSPAQWQQMPSDWGEEVISNIFVREPNALRGVLAQAARYLADGSCPVGACTYRSAYWAAQSAVAGARAVLAAERFAWALCRPPGHHARRAAAGGFCYINNAAVAAQVLRERFARVLILDTDMHHGQGVQEIFWKRSDVPYISIHGDPTNFYPVVAGHADECGEGEGKGFNLNLPMPHGASEAEFFARLTLAFEAARSMAPQALVLCLGFDIYQHDPQSLVAVTQQGFTELGRRVAALGLPTLVVQEGGYHLQTLQSNAQAFFDGLCG